MWCSILRNITVVLGIVLLSLSVAWAGAARNISGNEANEMLKKGGVFLLDVRTPGEYQDSRIKGSVLIPIEQVAQRIKEIPTSGPIIVYCAVGSRSSQVANYLASQGISEVYNLYGGIWGWKLKGNPVLQGAP